MTIVDTNKAGTNKATSYDVALYLASLVAQGYQLEDLITDPLGPAANFAADLDTLYEMTRAVLMSTIVNFSLERWQDTPVN
jgi:hypothetical protein